MKSPFLVVCMVLAVPFLCVEALPGAEESKMVNLLQSAFPAAPITVSLDRLIASVQSSRKKTKSVNVKNDPPPIFVSYQPAILLILPGQPVLGSINLQQNSKRENRAAQRSSRQGRTRNEG
ncbi:MAG TPA: hypothetical protein VGY91_06090 [Chthoniobacterales bacterium]|jgi:hypothetical protein|nr:hypothetical protein [Chthoniobacterales bacterium]